MNRPAPSGHTAGQGGINTGRPGPSALTPVQPVPPPSQSHSVSSVDVGNHELAPNNVNGISFANGATALSHPTGDIKEAGLSARTASALAGISKTPIPANIATTPAGWATWGGTLPANGGREVGIVVPPGTDLSKPVEVITYFHGMNADLADSLTGPHSINVEMARLAAGPPKRNAVFVLPDMNPPGKINPANEQWMDKPESVKDLQDQALNMIQTQWGGGKARPAGDSHTVIAHSFGGKALANSIDNGTMRADRIVMLDATYLDRGAKVAEYTKINPNVRVDVVYMPGGDTQQHAHDQMLGKPDNIHFYETTVEHPAIPAHWLSKNFVGETEQTPEDTHKAKPAHSK